MRNHIIFSTGRAGTNYLTSVLKQSPAIASYGEVFHASRSERAHLDGIHYEDGECPVAFLESGSFESGMTDTALSVGFRVFPYQMRGDDVQHRLWGKLSDYIRRGAAPIILYRENLFDAFMSSKIAAASGAWHPGEVAKPFEPIWINPDDAMQHMIKNAGYIHWLREFCGEGAVVLSLEMLRDHFEESIAKVSAAIGVDHLFVPTFHRKPAPDYSAVIANWDQVRQHFARSVFGVYVKESDHAQQASYA